MASRGPVLVTDAQDVPGLAAIRCLGTAGYEVIGAGLGARAAGLRSRHCAKRLVLPDPREQLSEFAASLGRIVEAEAPAAVVACRDETVLAISACRDSLPSPAHAGLPDHAVVERAFDRSAVVAAAARAGLPAPEQRRCAGHEDALEAASAFGWPVLVKPASTTFMLDGHVGRRPSELVGDPESLRTLVQTLGACMVERRVPGPVVSVGGVATPQGLLAAVVSRYLRTWPPDAGRSSYTETVAPKPGLIEQVAGLLGELSWTGLFELELIDSPSGGLHAIDFNPRPYGSLALARAAAVPLCAIWCDWLLEGRAEPLALGRPGVRFRNEAREFSNLTLRLRERQWASAAGIVTPRRETVHAFFEAGDPLPALVTLAAGARRSLRRDV